MAHKEIEAFVQKAKMAEVNEMISQLVSQHGTHTILTCIALDCALRGQAVLEEWQDAHTSQAFTASQQILTEAADKLLNLAVNTI